MYVCQVHRIYVDYLIWRCTEIGQDTPKIWRVIKCARICITFPASFFPGSSTTIKPNNIFKWWVTIRSSLIHFAYIVVAGSENSRGGATPMQAKWIKLDLGNYNDWWEVK